jgi:hypothetical protein
MATQARIMRGAAIISSSAAARQLADRSPAAGSTGRSRRSPWVADDGNTRGTLVPTTAVEQYAATMAQSFGISDPVALGSIFPYVKNFPTSNVGFLG